MNVSGTRQRVERTLELTEAGRLVLALAFLAVVVDVAGAGSARLAAATALAVLASAYIWASFATRGLTIEPPRAARPYVGERVVLSFMLRASRLLALRDIVCTLEGNPRLGVHVADVHAGRAQSIGLAHRFVQRGAYRRLKVSSTTTRPFGLVRIRIESDLAVDVIAVPRPLPLAFSDPPAGRAEAERIEAPCVGDEDFYTLRDWRVGESPRRIHWKTSARRGRRVRLETRRQAARPAVVVVSLRVPPGTSPGLFERAIRITAGLGDRALAARRPLRIIALGPGGFELGPLKGRVARGEMLEALATIESSPGDPTEELRGWLAQNPQRDPPEIVFLGSGNDPQPAGWIDVRDVLSASRTRRHTRAELSLR